MELSFNGDASLKAEHVAQAEHHAAQDMLLSGTYATSRSGSFKGCSVGCFAHEIAPGHENDNPHGIVAAARGLPEWLVRLQDSMFEGLPADERATFHVELAKRIPVGVSLEPVPHWLAMARIDRMLVEQRKALDANHPLGVHEAIQKTIAALEVGRRAHEAAAGGNSCELSAAESAAESAESAAWSAAESASADSAASAAWSAAESAARSAAWSARSAASAAWSAWSAAESAEESAWSAWSAAESAAESAAWSAAESAESAAESAAWSAWSAESAAWSAAESAWSAAWSAWKAERDALFVALDRAGKSAQ